MEETNEDGNLGLEELDLEAIAGRVAALVAEIGALPEFRNPYRKLLQALSRRIRLLHPLADDLFSQSLSASQLQSLRPLLPALAHAKRFLRSASAHHASKLSLVLLPRDRDAFLAAHHSVLAHLLHALAPILLLPCLSPEVAEQLHLIQSQLQRALDNQTHQSQQPLPDHLHRHLLSLYHNPQQSQSDPHLLHSLSQHLHLTTISDLKQESLAVHDMLISSGGTDPGQTVEKMSMLLKKIKDFVQTQNPLMGTVTNPNVLSPRPSIKTPSLSLPLSIAIPTPLPIAIAIPTPLPIPIPIPIPDEFRCPISLELMRDPVIVSTGQTYERACIEKWLESGHDTCPTTQQRLTHRSLTTNYVLRSLITQWCESNGLDPPKRSPTPASLLPPCTDLDALLVKLSSSDPNAQNSAAGEIRLLAKRNAGNRLSIAQAGAVPLLKDLLFSPDLHTQEHAVTALLNLSICEENKAGIMASGCVPGIVYVLKNGNMEARENAAATLFSLSVVDEYKVTIGAMGAIPVLVSLLSEGSHRGKKDAATALFNLCIYQGNKGKAVRAGVVPLVMGLVTDPVGSMTDEAMAILAILSSHPEGKVAIGTAEAVPVLVDMVRTASPRNRENAAAVLVHLCNGEEGAKFLGWAEECGLLGPIRDLAVNGTDRGKRKAVILLEKMSRFLVQKQEECSQEAGAGSVLGLPSGAGLVHDLVEQLSHAHEDV